MEPKSIDKLFWDAARLASPAERAAYLDRACAGDPERRRQVEELLEARAAAGSFLETPVVARGDALGDGTRTGPCAPDGDLPLDFLTPSDKPGSLGALGHYDVKEVIGRGGMGVVLKAFDQNLHRVVAIKVMAPQLAASGTARLRFIREARAAAAVAHEHVVTIHAVEEASGLPYIVMYYVAGQSLQGRLDRSGPMPVADILRIGMQTASGLAAAHAQGLVHRDVKPANILLENGVERVKLTDFGLARAADDASLTQSGQVAGTPQYMSPEQAAGNSVDASSDLFSLGSVLYAMCAGRPPFRASSSMAVLKRVCEETPTPIREVNPEVPEWLAAAIDRLHAKDPAARFQSAAEVAELLGRHLAHLQHPSLVSPPAVAIQAIAPSPAPRRRRWAVVAAVFVLLLAGLSTSEATGLTRIRSTVIRIFTPEGTLVVEAGDPDVKITVEGNGDMVITAAGVREIRLQPGSYRLRATRDGKPVALDRDLVTITRGATQVVRVRVEAGVDTPASSAATPKTAEPFVILARAGRREKPMSTLVEALRQAWNGDTIEVRSNGPLALDPLVIQEQAVRIRAGEAFRPVFHIRPPAYDSAKRPQDFLMGMIVVRHSTLVLEGLEFQATIDEASMLGTQPNPPVWMCPSVIYSHQAAAIHAANCRFTLKSPDAKVATSTIIQADELSRCDLRNCELITKIPGCGVWVASSPAKLRNNILVGLAPLRASYFRNVDVVADQQWTQNTVIGGLLSQPLGNLPISCDISELYPPVLPRVFPTGHIVETPERSHIEMSGNIIDGQGLGLGVNKTSDHPLELLPQQLSWRGSQNLFPPCARVCFLDATGHAKNSVLTTGLAEWRQFWGDPESGSVEGRFPRYIGGDVRGRANKDPEQLTPEDFRLHPESPGHAAGPDGKDLGADVDLVGPGPAYKRWKKTPDYQEWLKDTSRTK